MRALVANPFNATPKNYFDISRQTKDARSHVVLTPTRVTKIDLTF
jgi:hypothetical protein